MSEWWSAGDDSDGVSRQSCRVEVLPLGGTAAQPAGGWGLSAARSRSAREPLAGVGTIESQRTGWNSPVLIGGVAVGVLVLIMGGWTACSEASAAEGRVHPKRC